MGFTVVKITPEKSRCHFLIPKVSAGGIIIGEEYCLLDAGHDGPHRSLSGGVIVNHEGFMRQWEQGKI